MTKQIRCPKCGKRIAWDWTQDTFRIDPQSPVDYMLQEPSPAHEWKFSLDVITVIPSNNSRMIVHNCLCSKALGVTLEDEDGSTVFNSEQLAGVEAEENAFHAIFLL